MGDTIFKKVTDIEVLLKDVLFRYIEIYRDSDGKKHPKEDRSSFTPQQIKDNPGIERQSTHKSYYLKHSNVFCIDVDVKPMPIEMQELIIKYGIPFTETNGGYHLYVLSDVPLFQHSLDIFNNFKGDLIHYKQNIWELHKNPVYYAIVIPKVTWDTLKQYCNIVKMNFKKENIEVIDKKENSKIIDKKENSKINDKKEICKGKKQKNEENVVKVIEPKQDDVDIEIEQIDENTIKLSSGGESKKPLKTLNKSDSSDIQIVHDLVKLLDITRADDFDNWMRVGWCLHNIDLSLLDLWIKFSKRSTKFKEGRCEDEWGKMSNGDIGIGSLKYWARTDNPQKYFEIIYNHLSGHIRDSLKMTDGQIAKLFYKLRSDILVCAQETPAPLWYLYENGIWNKLDGSSKIRIMIFDDLTELYEKYRTELCNKLSKKGISSKEIKNISDDIIIIDKILFKLDTYSFITQVLNQCTGHFKRTNFIENLDENKYLLCFGKDTYDLKDCIWKVSESSNNISLKCGVTKEEINDKNLELIHKILADIFPNPEIKKYIINCLSMFLTGDRTSQKFYVFLGGGANGKTVLANFLAAALGDYCCDLPTNLITDKEVKATVANPELCRGKGKRLALFSEPCQGSKMNNSTIKRLTGGERVLCRPLYQNPIQYSPQFMIVILCNTTFELEDVADDSVPRRLNYVNFQSKFVDESDYNPKICFQKLANHKYSTLEFIQDIRGSLMYLLLENYKELSKNDFKFTIPKEVTEKKKDYIDDNDEVKTFLNEFVEPSNEKIDCITAKTLFHEYKNYYKEKNVNIRMKEKTFIERVSKTYPFESRYQPIIDNVQKSFRSVFTNIKFIHSENENENNFL